MGVGVKSDFAHAVMLGGAVITTAGLFFKPIRSGANTLCAVSIGNIFETANRGNRTRGVEITERKIQL